jgi:hypothetical protein
MGNSWRLIVVWQLPPLKKGNINTVLHEARMIVAARSGINPTSYLVEVSNAISFNTISIF